MNVLSLAFGSSRLGRQSKRLVNYISSSTQPHKPVLVEKAIEYLEPCSGKTFIDMTFGAGGHTRKLLEASQNIRVLVLDRDPVAYEYAKKLSKEYPGQVVTLLGRFSELPNLLMEHNIARNSIDGILFDFGCSSMQFDEPSRGFSVSHNGPLDMRMDKGRLNDQITAAEVLAKIDEHDLIKVLRTYGEEKQAKKIARAIIETRTAVYKIESTRQLSTLVASCFPDIHRVDKLQRPVHAATKTFQALRIFVNNELNEINYGMILSQHYLKIGGRLVTITFHSLEDTIVKRHINGNVIEGLANPVPLKYSSHDLSYDLNSVESLVDSPWIQLNKHVVTPEESELVSNPRSRSAKLRAAVKVK